jgi:hypothetical protein
VQQNEQRNSERRAASTTRPEDQLKLTGVLLEQKQTEKKWLLFGWGWSHTLFTRLPIGAPFDTKQVGELLQIFNILRKKGEINFKIGGIG